MGNKRSDALKGAMEKKGMVTLRQASAIAMVGIDSLREWVYAGKLPGVYYAGCWWVPEAKVKEIASVLEGGGAQ